MPHTPSSRQVCLEDQNKMKDIQLYRTTDRITKFEGKGGGEI